MALLSSALWIPRALQSSYIYSSRFLSGCTSMVVLNGHDCQVFTSYNCHLPDCLKGGIFFLWLMCILMETHYSG
jgi:hypothetical protein